MPSHAETWPQWAGRQLIRCADEISPPASDADELTAYKDDPVGFAINVLGIEPWSRQLELLRAPLDHFKIACISGRKVGKSTSLAILALWFYCSFPGARVVITAATDKQVNEIIWREVKRLAKGARIPIPGAAGLVKTARTGYEHPSSGAQIKGFTARDAEAMAGWSGEYILYLVDEASGVAPEIFAAIEGNRAGGNAWVFLISNPTKAHGEFYEAFHSRSQTAIGDAGYFNIHVDSRESPNVTGEWRRLRVWDRTAREWRVRERPIGGLAMPEWIESQQLDWGEDDPRFLIHIAGVFSVAEDAKIFRQELIEECQARWEATAAEGRIWIGVDPAGEGEGGDESAFCSRRGKKAIELRYRTGLSPEAHVAVIEDMIAVAVAAGAPRDPLPVVNVESEGFTSWKVYLAIRKRADSESPPFICSRIMTSKPAVRQPEIMANVRAELWANARTWAREGGAIPRDKKLADDLHAPEFGSDGKGRNRVTAKEELRKILGRSPDGGDAFVLSCWEPIWTLGASARAAPRLEAESEMGAYEPPIYNPYTAGDVFAGRSV